MTLLFGRVLLLLLSTTTVSRSCVWWYSSNYLSLRCGSRSPAGALRPINAVAPFFPIPPKHHPAFLAFEPWSGRARTRDMLVVDFLGVVIPYRLYCNAAYSFQVEAHAIRTRQCGLFRALGRKRVGIVQTVWPVVAEEYFEYADILDAVREYPGGRPFAAVELGAGYGHWTLAAHKALLQKHRTPDYRYLLVDVLDTLVDTARNLSMLNDLDPQRLHFHVGFVAATDASTPFRRERADANLRIYGEDWGVGRALDPSRGRQPVSLHTLFRIYDFPPVVDIVDMDVQRAEYDILADPSVIDLLTKTTKRVHIGTHLRDTHNLTKPIKRLFLARGWRVVWDFDHGHRTMTPYGPVHFGDGALSFLNPRLRTR